MSGETRREKSLRIGVHHADAVVWGPAYRTHLSDGNINRDSRCGARQHTWNVRSCPSAVLVRVLYIAPALFTRTSTASRGPSNPDANDRTDASAARSSSRTSTASLPVEATMSLAADAARARSRHAMTTRAPLDANSRAISCGADGGGDGGRGGGDESRRTMRARRRRASRTTSAGRGCRSAAGGPGRGDAPDRSQSWRR